MRVVAQGRDGKLRIYDGTSPPHYVEIIFENMDGSFPSARARGIEEIIPTTGGFVLAPANPSFDQAFYEPQQLSFSMWVNYQDFAAVRNALSGLDITEANQTWTVGSHSWTSVPSRGSIILPDKTYRATQNFFDEMKKKVMVETLWQSEHPSTKGSTAGIQLDEVYFPPQSIQTTESPDFVEMRIGGLVYGNISRIWAFTTGTSSI